MFERLAAWTRWRPGVRARAARTSADERRLWVRYPCEFETASCSLHAGQSRLEARVRDISGGGISLITSTPLEPGSLLTIELTTDAAADSQLLAYLVRSVPQADGVWENGCIFSLELSDEELARFGAARREAGEPDQRGWVRFPSAGRATYRSARQPEQPWRDARLLDISASGLGL
ncbi:MAG: PilZ domain-containing protein, partial [Planctomycetia bacterium]|nr:PilZ domain-containing protein [Planctomycetia bacterium]